MNTTPEVTIVMTPRDRFSYTEDAVEAVYKLSDIPFRFIFVDGGFPSSVRRYLEKKSKETGFKYIRVDHFLAPNHAKNLALPFISGKYAVFMDNDCLPLNHGWLGALVRCAEETGAAMVSPLTCEGWPEAHLVHFSVGLNHIKEETVDGKKERVLVSSIERQHDKLKDALKTFKRSPSELTELHAVLIRTDMLRQIGKFDPKMQGSREHIDLCLEVTTRGGKIYFEPTSQVRFLPAAPLGPSLKPMDVPYHVLRWSDRWWLGSLDHLRTKWGLVNRGYLAERYEDAGWRRKAHISKRISRKLTLGLPIPIVDTLVDRFVKDWSRRMAEDYAEIAKKKSYI